MSKSREELLSNFRTTFGIRETDTAHENLSYASIENKRDKLGSEITTFCNEARDYFVDDYFVDDYHDNSVETADHVMRKLTIFDTDDKNNPSTQLKKLLKNPWFAPYKENIQKIINKYQDLKQPNPHQRADVQSKNAYNQAKTTWNAAQQVFRDAKTAFDEGAKDQVAKNTYNAAKNTYNTAKNTWYIAHHVVWGTQKDEMNKLMDGINFGGVLKTILMSIPDKQYLEDYINMLPQEEVGLYEQVIGGYSGQAEFSMRQLTYARKYIEDHFHKLEEAKKEFAGYSKKYKPGSETIKAVSAAIGGLFASGLVAGGLTYAMPSTKSIMKWDKVGDNNAGLKSIFDKASDEYDLAKLNENWFKAQQELDNIKAGSNTIINAKPTAAQFGLKHAQDVAIAQHTTDEAAVNAALIKLNTAKRLSLADPKSTDLSKKFADAQTEYDAAQGKEVLSKAAADNAKNAVNNATSPDIAVAQTKLAEAQDKLGKVQAAYNTKAKEIHDANGIKEDYSQTNAPVGTKASAATDATAKSAELNKAQTNFNNAVKVGDQAPAVDDLEVATIVTVSLMILAIAAFITHKYAVEANIEKQKKDTGEVRLDKTNLSMNQLDNHIETAADYISNVNHNNKSLKDRLHDGTLSEIRYY